MLALSIPLRGHAPIVLQAGSALFRMDGLARLMAGELEKRAPAADKPEFCCVSALPAEVAGSIILQHSGYALAWQRQEKFFLLHLRADPGEMPQRLVPVWQLAVIVALLAAILRGKRIAVVHGALLHTTAGALLICGEGGAGKSTTARRWRDAGQECVADDLVLLELDEERITAMPLPTWSLCRETLTDVVFPIGKRDELIGVLGLGRGEWRDECRPLTDAEFFAQLYRSTFFHFSGMAPRLPETDQMLLADWNRRVVERLCRQFPPRGLFARLEGNICETLKEFL